MTIIELEEFGDDRTTYLKTLVEKTDEFSRMSNYFKTLGGDIEESDFKALHVKGDEQKGVSVQYISETSENDRMVLSFGLDIQDNSIQSINGQLEVKRGEF